MAPLPFPTGRSVHDVVRRPVHGAPRRSLSGCGRVKQTDARALDVPRVTGHKHEVVNEGCRCQEAIDGRDRVRHVQDSASVGDGG